MEIIIIILKIPKISCNILVEWKLMYEDMELAQTYQNLGEDSQGPKLITLPTPLDLTKCPLKRKSAKELCALSF